MALDKIGNKLPKGVTWVDKKQLYMGRFTYQGTSCTLYDKELKGIKKKLADKRYEVEHGISGKMDKITLDKWFVTWLNEYKKNIVKLTTYQVYENIYKTQIQNVLGNRHLVQIKPMHIQKLYNNAIERGLSAKYLSTVNAMLYNIFDVAIKNEILIKNPCNSVIKPQIEYKERRVLSPSEQERLLNFI